MHQKACTINNRYTLQAQAMFNKIRFFTPLLALILTAQSAFCAPRQVRFLNKTHESITVLDQRNYIQAVITVVPPRHTQLITIDTDLPLQWQIAGNGYNQHVYSSPVMRQAHTVKFNYQYPRNYYAVPPCLRAMAPAHIRCSSEISTLDWLKYKANIFYGNYTAGLSFSQLHNRPANNLPLKEYRFANTCYFMGKATTSLLLWYGFVSACPTIERFLKL